MEQLVSLLGTMASERFLPSESAGHVDFSSPARKCLEVLGLFGDGQARRPFGGAIDADDLLRSAVVGANSVADLLCSAVVGPNDVDDLLCCAVVGPDNVDDVLRSAVVGPDNVDDLLRSAVVGPNNVDDLLRSAVVGPLGVVSSGHRPARVHRIALVAHRTAVLVDERLP